MARIRIGINGFGRIGRSFARCLAAAPHGTFNLIVINDLTDVHTLAHLLEYDSVHGRFPDAVRIWDASYGSGLAFSGHWPQVITEEDPAAIKWADWGVDIVIESTGQFVDKKSASKHLAGGAKKVIISAPAISPDVTLCMGINTETYKPDEHDVISNASCTTNCLAPLAKVLHEKFGILSGMMTTIHSYARAASLSMMPTTTNVAKALEEVLPAMAGKLEGMEIRVPTPNVSLVDLTARLEKPADAKSINDAFRGAAAAGPLQGILQVIDEPRVSCDYKNDFHSASLDAQLTTVIGDQVKVMAWYDHETAYAQRLLDLTKLIGDKLPDWWWRALNPQ